MSKSIHLHNQLTVTTGSLSHDSDDMSTESQKPEDIVIEELSVELNKQFI